MQKEIKEKESVIKELFKLGAHFGFSRSRRHPSANSYIFGFKNKTAIVDLEKTLESLEKAKEFVAKIAGEGKLVLFVGTKRESVRAIKQAADSIDMPYVNERWIGGTFTNFKQIRSRVDKLRGYREKEKKGELAVYTKKERGVIAKEVEKLEKYFAGIDMMEKLPGAMIAIDAKAEEIALAEARLVKVPVVSLSGPDCDLRVVNYPIVANDASQKTIEFILKELASAYQEGKKAAMAQREKVEVAQ